MSDQQYRLEAALVLETLAKAIRDGSVTRIESFKWAGGRDVAVVLTLAAPVECVPLAFEVKT